MSDRKIKVACSLPNGIMLHLWKQGFDDGTGDGVKPTIKDGEGVRINGISAVHTGAGNTDRPDIEPAITEIPADWWEKWVEQNEGRNALLDTGVIYALDEGRPKTENA